MNVSQAKDSLRDATAAVTQANQDLADCREAISFGEATERDSYKAVRQVDRAREKEAQARSDLVVATRLEEAEAARQQAEAERIRRALDKITAEKRDLELSRWLEFLQATRVAAEGYDHRLQGFSVQLRELGAGPHPSRWSSWRALLDAIDDQARHVPPTRATKEA